MIAVIVVEQQLAYQNSVLLCPAQVMCAVADKRPGETLFLTSADVIGGSKLSFFQALGSGCRG